GFAEAVYANRSRRNSLLREVRLHRSSALLRELLVEHWATGAVCVAVDLDADIRVRNHDSRNLCQPLTRGWLQICAAGIKQNIRHADDQSACAVAGLQYLIQLR